MDSIGVCRDAEYPVGQLRQPVIPSGGERRPCLSPYRSRNGQQRAFGFSLGGEIGQNNPYLLKRLAAAWDANIAAGGDYTGFAQRAEVVLDEQYRRAIDYAPYYLGIKRVRIRGKIARYLQKFSDSECIAYLRTGKNNHELPETLSTELRDAAGPILALRLPAETPPTPDRVKLPEKVVKMSADFARLTPVEWQAAVDAKRGPQAECRARIALIDAMLALAAGLVEPVLPHP